MVLISLFELNTAEFTMLLGALPKTFQDGATKLLHNHMKNSSNMGVVSNHGEGIGDQEWWVVGRRSLTGFIPFFFSLDVTMSFYPTWDLSHTNNYYIVL